MGSRHPPDGIGRSGRPAWAALSSIPGMRPAARSLPFFSETATAPLWQPLALARLAISTTRWAGPSTHGDQHMPSTRRAIAILISLAILLPVAAAPVDALTLQRT